MYLILYTHMIYIILIMRYSSREISVINMHIFTTHLQLLSTHGQSCLIYTLLSTALPSRLFWSYPRHHIISSINIFSMRFEKMLLLFFLISFMCIISLSFPSDDLLVIYFLLFKRCLCIFDLLPSDKKILSFTNSERVIKL